LGLPRDVRGGSRRVKNICNRFCINSFSARIAGYAANITKNISAFNFFSEPKPLWALLLFVHFYGLFMLIFSNGINVFRNIMGCFAQKYFFVEAHFISFQMRYGSQIPAKKIKEQIWSILTVIWSGRNELLIDFN